MILPEKQAYCIIQEIILKWNETAATDLGEQTSDMVADLCSEKNEHIPFLYINLLLIIMKLLFNNKSYFWISRVVAHVQSWWMAYLSWVRASVHAKSLQSYLTLCNSMDCSPPGSSVHGLLQARTLEWVAMPSSKGPSQPRDQTCISCVYLHWQVGSLPLGPTGKPMVPIYIWLSSHRAPHKRHHSVA